MSIEYIIRNIVKEELKPIFEELEEIKILIKDGQREYHDDDFLNGVSIQKAFNISASTLSRRVKEGTITKHSLPTTKNPMYHVGELRAILKQFGKI